ncbi:MAG: DUF547 domain-containing protein [Pseudomonadota bacterium]
MSVRPAPGYIGNVRQEKGANMMIRSTILALTLAGAPVLASADTLNDAAETSMTQNRHADWTRLLGTYVEVSADGVNRVDYGALKANASDSAALDTYIASFETLDIDALTADEQFAAWANLYNAVTVRHIIERYPIKSIRNGYLIGPWKEVKVIADGREVSLDAIEHDILREEWEEPRVHYAVNCASYGCPNLLPKAWTAGTLDEDLDAAARDYVNHPRGVSIRNNGTLQVSEIYKWFREDFGGSKEGVIEHLLKHADDDLAAQIRAKPRITKHDYDWSLNDTESQQ